MTCCRKFIITKNDTGCPHSWPVTDCHDEIVVPYENKTYQYLISTKNVIEEQIIITRVLQGLYLNNVQNCIIQIIGVSLSTQMLIVIELLSKNNTVDICV